MGGREFLSQLKNREELEGGLEKRKGKEQGFGSGSARIRMFLPCPDPDPGKKVRK